ncbi:MAG: hypothetical protein Fur0022_42020 [Anaerolineales bacterium]
MNEAVERIVRRFNPLRIILFGSWARGDARPDSDLDLLIVLPQVENKRQTAIQIGDELSDRPTSKDIIVTTLKLTLKLATHSCAIQTTSHVCYLAQQAAEKALKAILVLLDMKHPYTHDLDRLREMIPAGWRVKTAYPKLYALTIWAVETRYPADMPDIVESDAR